MALNASNSNSLEHLALKGLTALLLTTKFTAIKRKYTKTFLKQKNTKLSYK